MEHVIALAALFAALSTAAVAADVDQYIRDRYRPLADHADQGLGLDEFEGDRRYTRPVERHEEARDRTAKHTSRANHQILSKEN